MEDRPTTGQTATADEVAIVWRRTGRGSADDSGSEPPYVGVMATFWTLGCDAYAPQRTAAFWAMALGYVKESGFDEPDNASIVDPDGRGTAISFLKVAEGKSSKNRLHIDVRVAGPGPWGRVEPARLIRQKVPELVAAGATVIREELYGGVLGHVVMQDPEGNEFCVA